MIYLIEKLLNIYIYPPFISVIQIAQGLPDCVMTASAWPEAIAVITEYLFVYIRYGLCDRLLYGSVER